MNLENFKKEAKMIRSNETYNVFDLSKMLMNLNLSLTELHGRKETGGHSHEDADEVYVFFEGSGKIKIGETVQDCAAGDVFLIPSGAFHKVYNLTDSDLKFWSIFEKYGDRK